MLAGFLAVQEIARGHVIMVYALLMGFVTYITRDKAGLATLKKEIANSAKLGPKVAQWLEQNADNLVKHPKLQKTTFGPATPTAGSGAGAAESGAAGNSAKSGSKGNSANEGGKGDAGKGSGKGGDDGKGSGKGGDSGKDKAGDGKAKKDCATCVKVGNPVDAINGCKVLFEAPELDFDLPAPLGLPWQRHYSSDNPRQGYLGQGWHLPISLALEFSEQNITLLDGLNRGITFPHIAVDESFYSRHEKLTLRRLDLFTFELTDKEDIRSQFKLPTPVAKTAQLIHRADRNGNTVRIVWNEQQQPEKIIDSAGRHLLLAFNRQGRLLGVMEATESPESPGLAVLPLVQYEYDEAGDLVRVRNRAGEVTREFAYKNHIMIKHAQPGGLISEYDYSEYAPTGRVVRNHTNTGQAWNLVYASQKTQVTDNLGRKVYYGFNDAKRFTGATDAMGGKEVRQLDAWGNLTALTNAAGHTTRYQYDSRSRLTRIQEPDGSVIGRCTCY